VSILNSDTGYTTESACHYVANNEMSGSWIDASYKESYEDCQKECTFTEQCFSFTYYSRTGPTANCHITSVHTLAWPEGEPWEADESDENFSQSYKIAYP